MGYAFLRANGPRSAWLITLSRWGCLPFTLIGGLICFVWSRDLWGGPSAGLVSLTLWCFEPFLMGHAELITNDCAATSLGLGAGYFLWRWLRNSTWWRAAAAGAALGLALLSKSTWLVLLVLWPVLWLVWTEAGRRLTRGAGRTRSPAPCAAQFAALLILAVYVLNLGYLFDGTLTRLGDYSFTSRALAGPGKPGHIGNRFRGTWFENVPVPLPHSYVIGIDIQKKDFETLSEPSFLLGEWKSGGWWYYYLYGLLAKTSVGLQVLVLFGILSIICRERRNGDVGRSLERPSGDVASPRHRPRAGFWIGGAGFLDLAVLAAHGAIVLVLVSSQTQFNHHVRYALPVLGFAMVFAGASAWPFESDEGMSRGPGTVGAG
nr:glycosyltransferase family 39 protein [Paludisphaera mucosa]